jgi:hypothetical protein
MSKNPYEIRLELLHIARDFIIEQNMNERIRLENDWGLEREKASIALSNGDKNAALPPFPSVPNMDADTIIKLAEKLNVFVSKND